MNRRAFITLIGGAAATWPIVARAQRAEKARRIGVLMGGAESDPESAPRVTAFERGLMELGWMSGRNVLIDYRWGAGEPALMKAFAKELVGLQPDVLLASTTPVAAALGHETGTIPIVFVVVSDPIGSGFIEGLARPGGNMTGFINIESSLGGKWLELLKELAPRTSHVAAMFNPETAPHAEYYLRPFEVAAHALAVNPSAVPVRSVTDIEQAILELGRGAGSGLIVLPDTFTTVHRRVIIAAGTSSNIPAVYPFRYMAADGGLISYGVDLIDLYHRAAPYVDRILRGGKPADLPVQQPTKFEFAINLKTAKALGLEVPPTLLVRADEVIE
jgi:putative tryptophan/tyrosine transport system substrate-binding protein